MAKEIVFSPATRQQARSRLLIFGPSGSGKTYTSLLIASAICSNLAVIDAEHASAAKYSDEFSFSHYVMEPPFHPQHYINAIRRAEEGGFDGLLIDSITHEWDGEGGVKEIVDQAAQRFGGNKWSAWSVGTPLHNQFIEAILASPLHVICTARAKTEWQIVEDERGKKQPVKIGLGPQQRDSIEYEFDVSMLMDMDNNGTIVKSRVRPLAIGEIAEKPGKEFGEIYGAWLNEGVEVAITKKTPRRKAAEKEAAEPEALFAGAETREHVDELLARLEAEHSDHESLSGGTWRDRMELRSKEWFRKPLEELSDTELGTMAQRLEATLEKLSETAPAAT